MGFFKKLFSSQEEELLKGKIKKKAVKKKTEKQLKKSSSEKSNEFLDALDSIMGNAKEMLIKFPKTEILQNKAVSIVEGFFYSNLINNFKGNLIEENLKEYNISEKEFKQIQKEFKNIFERCDLTLESGSNGGGINYNEYKMFREKLKQLNNGAFKLLIEIEEHVNLSSCQRKIGVFKKEVFGLGREFKMEDYGSFGFENYDGQEKDEDEDLEETSNEITNFDKFEIELEEDYEEDIDYTQRNITLKDENGYFYGDYNQSKNKKYIVAYSDALNGDEIPSYVYLIKDKSKILWKKDINRPNGAFVTGKGIVVIIDWVSFGGELTGKIYFFDDAGKKLLEKKVDSNIGGQGISDDEKEVIITTCNPENAFYLFDVENQKLVKKVENDSRSPVTRFDFNELKDKILKTEEFNQREYDSDKVEQERRIEDEEKKIEALKKKELKELNYEELVQLGSIFAGNFYGEMGNPKLAIKYFLEAVKRKQDKPKPYVLKSLGFCYEKISEFGKAIEYYNLALEKYPQYKKNSPVPDHIEFCKDRMKRNKRFDNDEWTTFICKRRRN